MTNKTTKFFAFLALFGIVISVVGTGLIIFFGDTNNQQEKVLIKENVKNFIDSGNIKISNSGSLELNNSGSVKGTGKLKK